MPPLCRYRRVFVRAWDCVTAAGDAAASWQACAAGRVALSRVAGIGWCGLVGAAPGATDLDDLAGRAAAGPWASIADGEHPPALAVGDGNRRMGSNL
ncbi:MAG: hypothetical protein H0W72_13245 [Planctomycetes bacterium]|nr:hypothetical protein [Planctomycetota bacterium]